MPRLTTRFLFVLLILCLSISVPFFAQPIARAASGPSVSTWLTTANGQSLLAPQSNQNFVPGVGTTGSIITVNDHLQYQQMVGFGGAMTDSSAYLIDKVLTPTERTALMQKLFGSTDAASIHMSFARIPMGSSDFSATPLANPAPYSYDEPSQGQTTDPNLVNFSISHDNAYITPTLRQALQINPNLTFMANPWSPPDWMKTNGSMIGNTNGQNGTLITADYEPLAQYFVKFIQNYQAQGVPVYAITPQNEPLYIPTGYPGMSFSSTQEATFINNNLGPALANAHLSTKILGYDFNWYNTTYPTDILKNAGSYVSGTAWHCYGGNPTGMTTVHNVDTSKDVYETECSPGIIGSEVIDETLNSVQNWAKTVLLWNIALDPHNEPRISGGCGACTGMVQIDQNTHAITYTKSYYQLGQVSKFVLPGAYRTNSVSFDGRLNTASFTNPDGSKVLVVHNTSSNPITFNVNWDNAQTFSYPLSADGIVTFKWSGNTVLNSAISINAGGAATGSFSDDSNYTVGSTYSTSASINTGGVTNPAPQAVYQTERYGNFAYTIPGLAPGGTYKVRLHFAEIYWGSSGKRLFDVTINGQRVLTNFDIYATAGGINKAIVEQFSTTADSTGRVNVQFSTVLDKAKVSGIEVTT